MKPRVSDGKLVSGTNQFQLVGFILLFQIARHFVHSVDMYLLCAINILQLTNFQSVYHTLRFYNLTLSHPSSGTLPPPITLKLVSVNKQLALGYKNIIEGISLLILFQNFTYHTKIGIYKERRN